METSPGRYGIAKDARLMVLTILTGSMLVLLLSPGAFFATPFVIVPAAVVWLLATFTAARLEEKRREAMFTQYGITVDRSVTPHIYAVTVPATWVKPELHRTRALLLADDVDPVTADHA